VEGAYGKTPKESERENAMSGIVFLMSYSIYPRRGGVHEQVYLLSRELRRRGYRVGLAYYIHDVLKRNRIRLPLLLSGLHPRLYGGLDRYDHIVMETAWPGLASLPLKLTGKKFILHLHSVESLPDFGLPWHQRLGITLLERISGKASSKILTVSTKDTPFSRRYSATRSDTCHWQST
jgi:glycosyltransferase involved in cell wall biosynthesis